MTIDVQSNTSVITEISSKDVSVFSESPEGSQKDGQCTDPEYQEIFEDNQEIVFGIVVMFVLLLIKKREIEVSHTIGGERGKVVSKGKGSVEGVDTTLVSNTLR